MMQAPRWRGRAGRALVAAAALVLASPAAGANKEHQQLMADIRMLQEQTQQLQVTLNALTDALKLVTTRIDEQANANRKALADQRVAIDTLGADVRIIREKLDDTNVRVASLSQELEAMRMSVATPASAAVPPPTGEPGTETAAGQTQQEPPPVAPPTAGLSPQRLFDTAYADYSAGQWTLAIQGFETLIRTFPRAEQADDAQLYIGEAYMLDQKVNEAVQAYDRVIANYPSGDATPLAYYKRGLAYQRLNQGERARESWQAVVQKYPDSDAARLAKQQLDRLARPERQEDR